MYTSHFTLQPAFVVSCSFFFLFHMWLSLGQFSNVKSFHFNITFWEFQVHTFGMLFFYFKGLVSPSMYADAWGSCVCSFMLCDLIQVLFLRNAQSYMYDECAYIYGRMLHKLCVLLA